MSAKRLEKSREPLCSSKTVVPAEEAFEPDELWSSAPARTQPGRPARAISSPRVKAALALEAVTDSEPLPVSAAARLRLQPLIAEWLLELRVMARSQRTIDWYQQKMTWYLEKEGGPRTLDRLTAFEVKRLLAGLQERGLSPNTVHGFFQVVRAFANWADREGYPVDPGLLKVRPPKVPQIEMETYSDAQLAAIFQAAPVGWSRLAIQILLGTGMRISELAALTLEDVEDDGEVVFLKIKRGKGAKFRRVPVSSRLRRELTRYLNRGRPETRARELLVLHDGRPVSMMCVANLLRRVRYRVGFEVHAHRFRHTFATRYLSNGGEMERLRRILGHTSYVMVMRYVHLDKGDLGRDFDLRAPF
jgi:site-specific recombinase XerD